MKNLKKSKIIFILVILCIIILTCIYIIAKNDILKSESEEVVNYNFNLLGENVSLNILENNVNNHSLENSITTLSSDENKTESENTMQNNSSSINIDNSSKDTQTVANNNKTQIVVDESNNASANATTNFVAPTYQKLYYGESENGRDLVYYSISPEKYTSTILMNFAIHGYEDGYAKDAQLLVNLAEYLKEYYQEKSEEYLYETRILIIPCANPDGLYEGTSNNGFGRCNAKGIDLNRDFDALHKVFDNARNYTQYPFSAKESQALRDLVYAENPDVVIDFHGWENCTIGDANVASVFKTHVGLNHKTKFNSNCNGYFSYWAHLQGASSLLVEFKNTNISKTNVAKAIDELLQEF